MQMPELPQRHQLINSNLLLCSQAGFIVLSSKPCFFNSPVER